MAGASFRVPFSVAGEGLFFYFNIADLEHLETTFGAGEVFSSCEEFLLNKPSATHTLKLLSIGLKHDDGSGKTLKAFPEKVEGAPEDLPFPMVDAAMPIMDAIAFCIYGKSHSDLVKEALERQEEMQKSMKKAESGDDPFPASEE